MFWKVSQRRPSDYGYASFKEMPNSINGAYTYINTYKFLLDIVFKSLALLAKYY